MKRPSKKFIVSGVAVVGITVLVLAGVALKQPLLEQWYLWKLESGDREQQWAAAAKLAKIGSKRAEEWYLEQLASDSDEDRRTAAEKLGEMQSVAALPTLVELFRQHHAKRSTSRSEHYSTSALVVIGEPAIPALTAAFTDENPAVRLAAWSVIEAMGPVVIPYLLDVLKDAHPLLREGAGYALGHFGSQSKEITPELIRQAYENESPDVRAVAVALIATIGMESPGGRGTLLRLLRDPDRDVRLSAAIFLGAAEDRRAKEDPRTNAAVSTLIEALSEENVDLRTTCCWALGEIGPRAKAAIPILKELERSGDNQLRKTASEALEKIQGESPSDDPQR